MTPTRDNPTSQFENDATYTDADARGLKDRVTDATSHVKNTAADFGRSAVDNIDRNLSSAAGALENAASTLRNRAGQGDGRVPTIARTAADKLDGTARYFREHDSREMVQQFESVVRQNPGVSIAAALGLGFLIGMSMKKDRY